MKHVGPQHLKRRAAAAFIEELQSVDDKAGVDLTGQGLHLLGDLFSGQTGGDPLRPPR